VHERIASRQCGDNIPKQTLRGGVTSTRDEPAGALRPQDELGHARRVSIRRRCGVRRARFSNSIRRWLVDWPPKRQEKMRTGRSRRRVEED
jgi:hypothetical protein